MLHRFARLWQSKNPVCFLNTTSLILMIAFRKENLRKFHQNFRTEFFMKIHIPGNISLKSMNYTSSKNYYNFLSTYEVSFEIWFGKDCEIKFSINHYFHYLLTKLSMIFWPATGYKNVKICIIKVGHISLQLLEWGWLSPLLLDS